MEARVEDIQSRAASLLKEEKSWEYIGAINRQALRRKEKARRVVCRALHPLHIGNARDAGTQAGREHRLDLPAACGSEREA